MDAPSDVELAAMQAAQAPTGQPGPMADIVVRWQSRFGLVVIEVRSGRIYVNGDLVERVPPQAA